MKTNKSIYLIITLLASMALTAGNSAVANEKIAEKTKAVENPAAVLEYKLALAEDGKTYQVIMKPSATPKPDINLTAQVTIKVPHDSKFDITAIKSPIEGANWVETSRVDAPKEDAKHDYISFSYIGLQGSSARNYGWKANKENTIFSFQNKTGCVDGVSLMAMDDPFNTLSNSANTNPGNQFTNLGWGSVSENNYKGNYGDPIACKK
jgi:hypothetical protein